MTINSSRGRRCTWRLPRDRELVQYPTFAVFPANGLVGVGFGAGIFRGQVGKAGIEAAEEFAWVLEGVSIPAHISLPHSGREFGDEATEQVGIPPEADETASAEGIAPGGLQQNGGGSDDFRGGVLGEG